MTTKAIKSKESRVRVDLGAEGIYVGERLTLEGMPWVGRVRLTGVLSPARPQPGGMGVQFTRGFRPGEFVEVKPWQLSLTPEAGHATYLAALQAQANRYFGSHASSVLADQGPLCRPELLANALSLALQAEVCRLATGKWHLGEAPVRSC